MANIEEVIARVEEWKGQNVTVKELGEGITNTNYKVTVQGRSYVIRIPGTGSDMFINRDTEMHNTHSASATGVGAGIFKFYEKDFVSIAEFIDGEVMSIDRFQNRESMIKAVKSIRKINNEASFKSKFIMFDKFDDYYRLVKEEDIKRPESFPDAERVVNRVRDRFLPTMPELVSCHNDLLSENFIEQKDTMRIIDWELSGLNEPCFELGDFSVEQGYGEEEDRIIIETYFGSFDERNFARMSVYKYMADILWTLWAVIQNHCSTLDFDFWEYGMNRFNRAMDAFETPDFGRWIELV